MIILKLSFWTTFFNHNISRYISLIFTNSIQTKDVTCFTCLFQTQAKLCKETVTSPREGSVISVAQVMNCYISLTKTRKNIVRFPIKFNAFQKNRNHWIVDNLHIHFNGFSALLKIWQFSTYSSLDFSFEGWLREKKTCLKMTIATPYSFGEELEASRKRIFIPTSRPKLVFRYTGKLKTYGHK